MNNHKSQQSPNQEFCLKFQIQNPNVKIHEIFRQLMFQIKLNMIALYRETPSQEDKTQFSSQKCLAMIQDFAVKSNRHLVTNSAKLKREMYEIIDPKILNQYEKDPVLFSLNNKKGNFIEKVNKDNEKNQFEEEKQENIAKQKTLQSLSLVDHFSLLMNPPPQDKAAAGDTFLLLIYDKQKKFDDFMINDSVFLFEKLIVMRQIQNPYQLPQKFFQSHQGLYFKEYSFYYQDFDLGIFHKDPKDKIKDLLRQYWSLANVNDAGYHVAFKKALFRTRNPETSPLEALLALDLLFQVEKKIEIRVSIEFYHIQVQITDNKISWIVSLSQHPACYFSPLQANEYLAFHIKNWRRIPNFFTEAMTDNIDKLYVANKSVLRLEFNFEHYKNSKFFQAYEKRLSETGKLERISQSPNYSISEYSKTPLLLNTKVLEKSQVPFHMKFLAMVMISHAQVDVYDLPQDFLEKYWAGERDKKNWEALLRNNLEMIAFNRELDRKYLSYQQFKELNRKYLKLLKLKEKLFDINTTANKNFFTFDSQIHNFEVQITPSCTYYLCSDIDLSQTIIVKFPEHVERFLLVKFIDENLEPSHSVRSILSFSYYKKFIEAIRLLGRSYEFFSFNSSQIHERAFWAFYSDKKIKASTLLGYLESQHLKQDLSSFNLNSEGVSEYVNNVSDQLKNSYDIFDVHSDEINVSPLGLQSAVERYVTIGARTTGLRLRKFTYEGYISGDLLEEISAKFCFGNLPGLILRTQGQDLLVIRNPNPDQKRSLDFYEDVFKAYHLESVRYFEIVEIPHYRPAFLNKYLIKLFDSFFCAWSHYEHRNNSEYLTFIKGIQTVLSRFSEHLASDSVDLFKRVIFSSKYANNVLNPILSMSRYFPQDLFFSKLRESINLKVNYDIYSKMKINTEFGAYLLGIVDDSGNLKRGEIYYDIDNPLEKAAYQENLFPFVVVVRKPYMDFSLLDEDINSSDIRVFEVNLTRYLRNDAYKNLKNCIVFSHEDKEFVLNSCGNINNIKRSNYFLLFWDQHLIPERFQKFHNPLRPGPIEKKPPLIQENSSFSSSSSENKLNVSFLPLQDNIDSFAASDDSRRDDVKFNQFKVKMMNSFLKLIRNPRMKNLKNLHLAYADLSSSDQKNLLALISYCYREFNTKNPLTELQKENAVLLLNLFESSKYLPVHNYNKEIRSANTTTQETLLSKIYEVVMLNRDSLVKIYPSGNTKINPLLIHKGYEKYLKHGLKVLILYKYDIQRLCFLYNCSNESDLFISFNKRNKLVAKELKSPHFSENSTHLKDYIRVLTKKYQQLFSVGLKNSASADEPLSQASAWYLCSLYHFWKDDEKFIELTKKEELKNLLIGLEYLDVKHAYGLPWIVASNHLNTIRINNI